MISWKWLKALPWLVVNVKLIQFDVFNTVLYYFQNIYLKFKMTELISWVIKIPGLSLKKKLHVWLPHAKTRF